MWRFCAVHGASGRERESAGGGRGPTRSATTTSLLPRHLAQGHCQRVHRAMSSLDPAADLAGEFDSVSLDDDAPSPRHLAPRTSIDSHPPGAPAGQSHVSTSHQHHPASATDHPHGDDSSHERDQPRSSSHSGAFLGHGALQGDDDSRTAFQSVSLDPPSAPSHPHERDTHRSSPSPSSASSPPHSPSLASTAPTTLHDPSSSTTDVDAPTRATSAGDAPHHGDAAPVASTSAPAPAAAAAAAAPSPKKLVSTKRPTIMQKVVSMTRQRDLPPKPREEEVRRSLSRSPSSLATALEGQH